MNDSDILQNLAPYISKADKIWIGFSGGLDSTVLLHWCSGQNFADSLCAIHVNHGLAAQSGDWQQQCESFCIGLGIPFASETVKVVDAGKGLEAAARSARYQVFERTLGQNDILLSAHHLADQVETFLFRLMRGAGVKGLGAIPFCRPLGDGVLIRPFLSVEKQDLEQYAVRHSLTWVEDPSNQNTDFDRNFLRHDILSLIQKRWPKAQQNIARAAQHLADADEVLAQYAQEDLRRCDLRHERLGESISVSGIREKSIQRRRVILRSWIGKHCSFLPQTKHLAEVEALLQSRQDAQASVEFGDWQMRRFQERLYLIPKLNDCPDLDVGWDLKDPISLGDGFVLRADQAQSVELRITRRQEGLRCQPIARNHSQSLKKLFQEYSLEPWLRGHIPILWHNNNIVAVGDLFCCDHQLQALFESIQWQYQPALSHQAESRF